MDSKRRATLTEIFTVPTPTDIPWAAIESLILALGGAVISRMGTRVGDPVGFVGELADLDLRFIAPE